MLREILKQPDAELRDTQADVIERICEGQSVISIARTGSGKSATYLLSTKILRQLNPNLGPTLVIGPLKGLMNDQLKAAEQFGLVAECIRALSIDSPLDRKMKFERIKKTNKVDLVFLTPEMVDTGVLQEYLPQFQDNYEYDEEIDAWERIGLVVLDECHCLSDWGHDFRPAYWKLSEQFSKPWMEQVPILAMTATVTPRVTQDLEALFRSGDPNRAVLTIRGSLERQNIRLRVITSITTTEDVAKWDWVERLCKKHVRKQINSFRKNKVPRLHVNCFISCRTKPQFWFSCVNELTLRIWPSAWLKMASPALQATMPS
jgi:ATP-dependent DNA helicase RecQ